jgi:hypothetical protein
MTYFTKMHRRHLHALSTVLAVTAVSAAAVAEDRNDDRSAVSDVLNPRLERNSMA